MRTALRTVLLAPPSARTAFDPDTRAYITAVESADGQALEPGVRTSLDTFVRGCKADGIWDAIKASCIMAGARTLAGALVPLKGTAPTNFNFVSGDYNRKTGLVGDGSTKYLDSNRNNDADPQDSQHACLFATTPNTGDKWYMGAGGSAAGSTNLPSADGGSSLAARSRSAATLEPRGTNAAGLLGVNRSGSSDCTIRSNDTSTASVRTSQTPANASIHIYAESSFLSYRSDARLAFYSIGESLDLALLDARVTTLVNTFASTIP